MRSIDLSQYLNGLSSYTELRFHENSNNDIMILNGNVVSNTKSVQGGVSARVFKNGMWGFSSSSDGTSEAISQVLKLAQNNADFLGGKSQSQDKKLEKSSGKFTKEFYTKKKKWSQKERIDFLQEVDTYITKTYPQLSSRALGFSCIDFSKQLATSNNSNGQTFLPRSHFRLNLTIEKEGKSFSLADTKGGLGEIEDVFSEPKDLFSMIDDLFHHLEKKKEGVLAKGGVHDVVLGHSITGILAHEAVGHTVEADLVLGGSVAGELLNQTVASPLVSMTDFAHSAFGEVCHVPVYIDDEGTPSQDAELIKNGQLKTFMHNRESAAHFGHKALGNARAFNYFDEPLIRMRNTAILPGQSELKDMISSVESGYYFTHTSNGQADSTGEFMFGVPMGYEIKNGQLGQAVIDTTISGVAFEMLKTVDAVGNDFKWMSSGFCGKKQRMSVSFGGPSIKCKINVGGQ